MPKISPFFLKERENIILTILVYPPQTVHIRIRDILNNLELNNK